MTVRHSLATDPELHEPKGVAAANSSEVYIANGSGSGAWDKPTLEDNVDTATAAIKEIFVADGAGSGDWERYSGSTYGEMYISGNTTATVIAASSTYVTVNPSGEWVVGHQDNVTGTAANGTWTIITPGDYKLSASISFEGATNDIWKFDFALNGTPLAHGAIRRKTANADVGALYLQTIDTLALNDVITLVVQNETDTDNVIITDANFMIELKEAS